MSRFDLALWTDIYAAMGVCCTIAAIFSAIRICWYCQTDDRRHPAGVRGWILAAPLLWWRWQKVYLTSAPVTLGIIVLFGWSLPWTRTPEAPLSPALIASGRSTAQTRN